MHKCRAYNQVFQPFGLNTSVVDPDPVFFTSGSEAVHFPYGLGSDLSNITDLLCIYNSIYIFCRFPGWRMTDRCGRMESGSGSFHPDPWRLWTWTSTIKETTGREIVFRRTVQVYDLRFRTLLSHSECFSLITLPLPHF